MTMNQTEKIEFFKRCIAEYFNEDPGIICTSLQQRPVPTMKKILCYLLAKKMDMEVVLIAKKVFVSADHSNVYNALKSLKKDINEKPEIKEALITIIEKTNRKRIAV